MGDYVELMAFQTSGAALNVNTGGNYTPQLAWIRFDGAPISGWQTVTYGTNWQRYNNLASEDMEPGALGGRLVAGR